MIDPWVEAQTVARANAATARAEEELRYEKLYQESIRAAAGLDKPAEGLKFDDGKVPLHLLPPDALYAIAEILDFGQKKYAPRNWEKGMNWSRVYRGAIGHLFQWFMGKTDEETGKSHLWHAGACVLFLISFELRKIGTDDRPGADNAG